MAHNTPLGAQTNEKKVTSTKLNTVISTCVDCFSNTIEILRIIPNWYTVGQVSVPLIGAYMRVNLHALLQSTQNDIIISLMIDIVSCFIQYNIYRTLSYVITSVILSKVQEIKHRNLHDTNYINVINDIFENKHNIHDFFCGIMLALAIGFDTFAYAFDIYSNILPIDLRLFAVCICGLFFLFTNLHIIKIIATRDSIIVSSTTARILNDAIKNNNKEVTIPCNRLSDTFTTTKQWRLIVVPLNIVITCIVLEMSAKQMNNIFGEKCEHTLTTQQMHHLVVFHWMMSIMLYYVKSMRHGALLTKFIIIYREFIKNPTSPINQTQPIEQNTTQTAPQTDDKPQALPPKETSQTAHDILDAFRQLRVDDPEVLITDINLADDTSRKNWREKLVAYITRTWSDVKLEEDLEPLADFFLTNQQNNKAIVCYLIMLERRQLVPKFYNNAALAFLRMEQPAMAYKLATCTIIIKPDSVQAYSIIGLAAKKMQLYAIGCVSYSKLLSLDPTHERGQLGYNLCAAIHHQTPNQPLTQLY